MLLNARQIHFKEETFFHPIILLAMEDVTDMMVVAETLADHTNKLETKFTERTSELENQIKKLEKEINGFKKKTRK